MLSRCSYRLLAFNTKSLLIRNNCNFSNISDQILTKQHIKSIKFDRYKSTSTTTAEFLPSVRELWNKLFGKYLLATNIISSGVLMVAGDIAAQEIEYRRGDKNGKHFDFKRMWRMFIAGAMQGPLHHYVYGWMDRVMPLPTLRNVIQKILIDQIIMSPLCLVTFFYTACYMENKTISETNKELIDKFPIIYLMDWLMWPGAQYFNFRYLDTKYRVMFVNVFTAIYNVFMSYMKNDFDLDYVTKFNE